MIPQLIDFAWKITIVLEACVTIRLFTSKLRYSFLFRFFLGMFLFDCGAWLIGINSPRLYNFYLFARCITAVVACFVTLEVFESVYDQYPGVRILKRRASLWAMIVGLLASVLAVPLTFRQWSNTSYQCIGFPIIEMVRCTHAGYAAFLAIMYSRLRSFPVILGIQTQVHFALWFTFVVVAFAGDSISLVAHSTKVDAVLTLILNCVESILCVGWIALFSLDWRHVEKLPRRDPNPDVVAGFRGMSEVFQMLRQKSLALREK